MSRSRSSVDSQMTSQPLAHLVVTVTVILKVSRKRLRIIYLAKVEMSRENELRNKSIYLTSEVTVKTHSLGKICKGLKSSTFSHIFQNELKINVNN